jgi:hypothetical protein
MFDISLLNSPTGIDNGTNPRPAINLPLTGSLDGGGLGVGTFRRASVAWYFDNTNTLQQAAIDEPRFTGNGLLLEGAGTNVCLQSRIITSAPWTSNVSSSARTTGIDGSATGAISLTDASGSGSLSVLQGISYTAGTDTHCGSVFVKKNTEASVEAGIQINFSGGGGKYYGASINTSTGVITALSGSTASGTVKSESWGDWWRAILTITDEDLGDTTLTMYMFPARTTTPGSTEVTATGTNIFDCAQVELNQSFASSPIITTTIAVTRATEDGVAGVSGAEWDLDGTGTLGADIVTNGDAELDSGWTDNNTPTVNERSAVQAHSGTYSRKFTVDSQWDGVQTPPFTTVAGTRYKIVLWVYPDDTTSVSIIFHSTGHDYNATSSGLTQDAWNKIVLYVTATGSAADGYLSVASPTGVSAGSWYVDDVVIKPVTDSLTSMLAETLGSDLVTNGGFDADSDWTDTYNCWAIAAGVAHSDGTTDYGGFDQTISITAGNTYKVTYTISNYVSGDFSIRVGGPGGATPTKTANGTYVAYVIADSINSDISLVPSDTFVADIDNVVVKKVTNDSRGTLVVDWTPGVDYDQGPAAQSGIITSNEDSDATLFYYSGTSNDRFRSNDNVGAPYEALQFTVGTTYRWSVRWGIDNNNVRQFKPGLIISGAVTTDFTTDYDGAYVLGTLLLLGRSLAFPFNVKNLKFFSGAPLTDAELLAL